MVHPSTRLQPLSSAQEDGSLKILNEPKRMGRRVGSSNLQLGSVACAQPGARVGGSLEDG
ncbi:hypothetical protein JMJ77_0013471 [Colletotrichum scovillei]|uniref:Uncharacterized protein n=1 Tax=Colletotrichum scovillei TaxID=1209932 RepID=A0A9P7R5T0_9PEZI|nr:hypothetical protein JMJ77_0013471 [Colletotrichum scovillei]KAG7069772.1 hypothetical protein JMJ76_0003435 [Colletotrichum scovillei]KAG7073777.1 hypothetical protein JMJ78_0014744 [Colletotrichum scovillei]